MTHEAKLPCGHVHQVVIDTAAQTLRVADTERDASASAGAGSAGHAACPAECSALGVMMRRVLKRPPALVGLRVIALSCEPCASTEWVVLFPVQTSPGPSEAGSDADSQVSADLIDMETELAPWAATPGPVAFASGPSRSDSPVGVDIASGLTPPSTATGESGTGKPCEVSVAGRAAAETDLATGTGRVRGTGRGPRAVLRAFQRALDRVTVQASGIRDRRRRAGSSAPVSRTPPAADVVAVASAPAPHAKAVLSRWPRPEMPLDVFKIAYVLRGGNEVDGVLALLHMRVDLASAALYDNDTGARVGSDALAAADGRQVVFDDGVVITAFILSTVHDPSLVAEEYRQGRVRLCSQVAVNRREFVPKFYYEVGTRVREPRAGQPGLHGCLQGIHAFTTKAAAVRYAAIMDGHQTETQYARTVLVHGAVCVQEVDMVADWWPYNQVPVKADTVCVTCARPVGGTAYPARLRRVAGCGHALCDSCARGLISTKLLCPACAFPAPRVDDYPWS
jgi:hypothetical protein